MNNSKTLAILKPDAIARNHTGAIISKINEAGFKILAMKMIKLNKETAEGFYDIHKGKTFFAELIKYMTSGPIIPMVLSKKNAVDDFRKLIGTTDPEKAEEGTIRRLFAENMTHNSIHGSDSNENAKNEIAYFFSLKEIVKNTGTYK